MVDVCVRQEDSIQRGCIKWKCAIVQLFQGLCPLKHAAFNQYPGLTAFKQHARTGDATCSAIEAQNGHRSTICWSVESHVREVG